MVESLFAQRLRRWTNVKPTLIQRLTSAGICLMVNATACHAKVRSLLPTLNIQILNL